MTGAVAVDVGPGLFTGLRVGLAHGKAMVIGTTGLSAEQRGRIADASAGLAIMQAPNMSLGVNLLFKIAAAYEAATKRRQPPADFGPLAGEP